MRNATRRLLTALLSVRWRLRAQRSATRRWLNERRQIVLWRTLFERLDTDGSGTIEWEEFYELISEWMDTGFNRLEQLRAQEKISDDARKEARDAYRDAEDALWVEGE